MVLEATDLKIMASEATVMKAAAAGALLMSLDRGTLPLRAAPHFLKTAQLQTTQLPMATKAAQ